MTMRSPVFKARSVYVYVCVLSGKDTERERREIKRVKEGGRGSDSMHELNKVWHNVYVCMYVYMYVLMCEFVCLCVCIYVCV